MTQQFHSWVYILKKKSKNINLKRYAHTSDVHLHHIIYSCPRRYGWSGNMLSINSERIRRWYTHAHIHTHHGILLSCKNEQSFAIAATWLNLMLSEINRTMTNTVWYHLRAESKKFNKLVNIIRKNSVEI